MRFESVKASGWGSRVGRLSVGAASAILRLFRFSVFESHLDVAQSRKQTVFVMGGFYRPLLIAFERALWGWKWLRVPSRAWEDSAGKVLNNPQGSSEPMMPLGFVLSRALPQTEFSISRESGVVRNDSGANWVLVGDETHDLVQIRFRTRSYFHFLLETIPVILENLDTKRMLVRVESSWQQDLLSYFGIDFMETNGGDVRHDFTIAKSKWGLYPREDHICALSHVLSNIQGLREPQRLEAIRAGMPTAATGIGMRVVD